MADDGPTVIIPSLRCWLSHAGTAHRPHLIGDPPSTKRCDGQPVDNGTQPPQPEE